MRSKEETPALCIRLHCQAEAAPVHILLHTLTHKQHGEVLAEARDDGSSYHSGEAQAGGLP